MPDNGDQCKGGQSQARSDEKTLGRAHKVVRRALKGILLLGWIAFLLSAALLAWSQQATNALSSAADIITGERYREYYLTGVSKRVSPPEELAYFLQRYSEDPPPVAVVLNQLVKEPGWDNEGAYWERLEQDLSQIEKTAEISEALRERYRSLFAQIADVMHGFASDPTKDSKKIEISSDILPELFRPVEGTYSNAEVMTAWIERERIRIKNTAKREALGNTFLLLLVLGALGSTIFLTRAFIIDHEETPVAAYLFRPVLGMFLALALFVVDIFTHSIISTASVLELRQEPLLLLAFAAGLLSEQAYAALEVRTSEVLDQYKKSRVRAKAISQK